jgi:hypothetical protein
MLQKKARQINPWAVFFQKGNEFSITHTVLILQLSAIQQFKEDHSQDRVQESLFLLKKPT